MPREMFKSGTHVVDAFSSEDAKAWRDRTIAVGLQRLLGRIRIVIGQDPVSVVGSDSFDYTATDSAGPLVAFSPCNPEPLSATTTLAPREASNSA